MQIWVRLAECRTMCQHCSYIIYHFPYASFHFHWVPLTVVLQSWAVISICGCFSLSPSPERIPLVMIWQSSITLCCHVTSKWLGFNISVPATLNPTTTSYNDPLLWVAFAWACMLFFLIILSKSPITFC